MINVGIIGCGFQLTTFIFKAESKLSLKTSDFEVSSFIFLILCFLLLLCIKGNADIITWFRDLL